MAAPNDVVATLGKGVVKRYNVYRNNVTVSLIDALAAIYPDVQRITGVEFFRAMARSHIHATLTASKARGSITQQRTSLLESKPAIWIPVEDFDRDALFIAQPVGEEEKSHTAEIEDAVSRLRHLDYGYEFGLALVSSVPITVWPHRHQQCSEHKA